MCEGGRTVSSEENKATERRFSEEGWNKDNLGTVAELVAPDVVEHNPVVPGQAPGLEGFRQMVKMSLSAFPAGQITIEDLIAEGDEVVVRWTAYNMTHRGEFAAIPATGKHLTVAGIDLYRY